MALEKAKKYGPALDAKVCSNCLTPEDTAGAPKLSACSRCGLVAYCSKDCQRAHWKANHKQHCVARADRRPEAQTPSDARENTASKAASDREKCSICLGSLAGAPVLNLDCAHEFHTDCVAQLRKFGVEQCCPLCRTPLPPGPAKLFEDAIRRYMVVQGVVSRRGSSWSTIPASTRAELDGAISSLRAAADQGSVPAQACMGLVHDSDYGVLHNDVERFQWFKKAATEGHVLSQSVLGCIYREGQGVEANDEEAARWLLRAAQSGDKDAQCNMGAMFYKGHGVAKCYEKVAQCWKKQLIKGT